VGGKGRQQQHERCSKGCRHRTSIQDNKSYNQCSTGNEALADERQIRARDCPWRLTVWAVGRIKTLVPRGTEGEMQL
jgi:hypothetical protein